MNTAIIITAIICGTILCVFGISVIATCKQRKTTTKAAERLMKMYNDEEDED